MAYFGSLYADVSYFPKGFVSNLCRGIPLNMQGVIDMGDGMQLSQCSIEQEWILLATSPIKSKIIAFKSICRVKFLSVIFICYIILKYLCVIYLNISLNLCHVFPNGWVENYFFFLHTEN